MKRGFETNGDDNQKRTRTHEGESNVPNRTIYIGSLHPQTSIADLCDLIQDGPLDQVRVLPNKNCAFISFLDDQTGIAAHARLSANPPALYGKPVVIGWGASRILPDTIAQAVGAGASRNVFIGGSVDRTSEAYLRDALSRFGLIDCIDMLPAKKIAFVHFASIAAAITCKEALQADQQWVSFKLNYGKDRCCADVKGRSHGESKASGGQGGATRGFQGPPGGFGGAGPGNYGGSYAAGFAASGMGGGYGAPERFHGGDEGQNRTVYLGGVTEEYSLRDILDNVYGGILDQVKVLPDKKCCFISFVEPAAAQAFYARTAANGFYVGDKTCKIGWGKMRPLPAAVIEGVMKGATRNLFIGNIDPSLTVEKLQADLAEYGPIEKVDILQAKKIAFVHFTSINKAMQAAEHLRTEGHPLHEAYATCRINFGKDRCASDAPSRPRAAPSYRNPAPEQGYQQQAPQAQQGYSQDAGGYNSYPAQQGWTQA